MLWFILVAQLWTPDTVRRPGEILKGNWQSCKQEHVLFTPEFQVVSGYAERIFDYDVNGVWKWSFHMGPYHEFALYKASKDPTQINYDNHDHTQVTNLLGPGYTVTPDYSRGRREWSILDLRLHVSVVMAGGSRDDCESFFVLIRRIP